MKVRFKKEGNNVLGVTLECSAGETLIIMRALRTELLANKTLYKGLSRERDNMLIKKMIVDMEGAE